MICGIRIQNYNYRLAMERASGIRAVPYSVGIGPAVQGVTLSDFASEVSRVLSDPRGWRKYGLHFYQVPPRKGVLHIHLEVAETAAALCGTPGFSCWRDRSSDIVINLTNWLGGSQSGLPLERYHNYVISHEVGHSLGLGHQKCQIDECRRRGMGSCPASVMQQMTRGPAAIWPCVESDRPLDPDWEVDDPRPMLLEAQKRGAAKGLRLVLAVLLVLALVLAAAVMTLRGGRSSKPHARGAHRVPPLGKNGM